MWQTVSNYSGWDIFDVYLTYNQVKLGTFKAQPNNPVWLYIGHFYIYIICTSLWLHTCVPQNYKFIEWHQCLKMASNHIMYNSTCSGFENSLIDCEFTFYGKNYWPRTYTASALCSDGEGYTLINKIPIYSLCWRCTSNCEAGEIRSVRMAWKYKRAVEVCLENLWGLIAEIGWS